MDRIENFVYRRTRSQWSRCRRLTFIYLGVRRRKFLPTRLRVSVSFLDSLLVLPQLLLNFLHRGFKRFHQTVRLLVGDEIVFMFRGYFDIDLGRLFITQVDYNLDGGQALEKPAKLFRLLLELSL